MQSASLIDLGDLDPIIRMEIEGLIRRNEIWSKARTERAEWDDLFKHGTDAEIIAKAESLDCWTDYDGYRFIPPITLANRYSRRADNDEIFDLRDCPFDRHHPRRPVIMRGSVSNLIRRHRSTKKCMSPHGLATSMMYRLLTLYKVTLWDREELNRFNEKVRSHSPKWKFRDFVWRGGNPLPCSWVGWDIYGNYKRYACVIRGELTSLSESEYDNISALRKIIAKTEKLDMKVRKELARQHMRERMLRAEPAYRLRDTEPHTGAVH